jgi:hypothetical protein
VESALLEAGVSALLLALNCTVKVFGRAGNAIATGAVEVMARYVPSEALVAVTKQVPALVAESKWPETEQSFADPLTTLKDSPPVSEPPEVTSLRALPTLPWVDVTWSAAWVSNRGAISVTKA